MIKGIQVYSSPSIGKSGETTTVTTRSVSLASPERCRLCGSESRVLRSRSRPNMRWRRRECLGEGAVPNCRERWTTYETRLNPRKINVRVRETREADNNPRPAR